MKHLFQTLLIMLAVTAIGVIVSALITISYDNKVTVAREAGYAEGQTQGRRVGIREGSEAGYQDGSKVGYARSRQESAVESYRTDFYFVYNPTFDEVMSLLRQQEVNSALELHDYAEAHGLRSAYVRVEIDRPAEPGKVWVYRLVAFDTLDEGLIIIEPTTREIVTAETGLGFREQNNFPPTPDEDTVSKVTFIW